MTSVATPALEDGFTARLLFAVSARRVRALVLFGAATVVLAAMSMVKFVVAGFPTASGSVATLYLPLVSAVFWRLGTQVQPGAVDWRWVPRRLLAEQSWRETQALVLNTRGTVLVLSPGEYVRVYGLPPALREVLVRARRVRLVGPDDEGRLAVRVDGSYVPWPARRIEPQRATAALPTAEPIAAMWVRLLVGFARPVFVFAVVLTVAVVPMAAFPGRRWWDFLVLAVYVISAVVCWSRLRYVARLRHTGPWFQADAEISSWRERRNGLADGTVALRLPDGRRFTAQLDRAPLDLFANVAHDKILWVADNGVVGFPYYPIVAAARLTPQG
jgi:hypothetical protein